MIDRSTLFATVVTALAITATGCSSGGGGSSPAPAPAPPPPPPPTPTPTLQVLPAAYDFGRVTATNAAAPLEVTIRNTGTAALNVSSIGFQAPADSSFVLNLSGGTKPCASASPTIAASDSCTVQVSFHPSADGTFNSTLQINSNDRTAPVFGLPIAGAREQITAWALYINQIDLGTCPEATAYVTVIDQGGFPVTNLTAPNFTVSQGTASVASFTVTYVDATASPVAISAVLDHSGSLTDQTVAFADMKTGFKNLFGSMRAGDIGQVIKFDDAVEVVEPFTMDKLRLQAAVEAPFDKGRNTKLYDAAFLAVDEMAPQTAYRRAVVVATDGRDQGPTVPYSTHTLAQVIANAVADKVPVFTIGLGLDIDRAVLQQMATGTGGVFYEASTSQNLANIYNQLSTILYSRQYVVKFNRLPAATPNSASTVTIRASSGTLGDDDTRPLTLCN